MEKSKRRKVSSGSPEKRTRTKDDDEDDWDMALNTHALSGRTALLDVSQGGESTDHVQK
jgi:hypothetical protein